MKKQYSKFLKCSFAFTIIAFIGTLFFTFSSKDFSAALYSVFNPTDTRSRPSVNLLNEQDIYIQASEGDQRNWDIHIDNSIINLDCNTVAYLLESRNRERREYEGGIYELFIDYFPQGDESAARYLYAEHIHDSPILYGITSQERNGSLESMITNFESSYSENGCQGAALSRERQTTQRTSQRTGGRTGGENSNFPLLTFIESLMSNSSIQLRELSENEKAQLSTNTITESYLNTFSDFPNSLTGLVLPTSVWKQSLVENGRISSETDYLNAFGVRYNTDSGGFFLSKEEDSYVIKQFVSNFLPTETDGRFCNSTNFRDNQSQTMELQFLVPAGVSEAYVYVPIGINPQGVGDGQYQYQGITSIKDSNNQQVSLGTHGSGLLEFPETSNGGLYTFTFQGNGSSTPGKGIPTAVLANYRISDVAKYEAWAEKNSNQNFLSSTELNTLMEAKLTVEQFSNVGIGQNGVEAITDGKTVANVPASQQAPYSGLSTAGWLDNRTHGLTSIVPTSRTHPHHLRVLKVPNPLTALKTPQRLEGFSGINFTTLSSLYDTYLTATQEFLADQTSAQKLGRVQDLEEDIINLGEGTRIFLLRRIDDPRGMTFEVGLDRNTPVDQIMTKLQENKDIIDMYNQLQSAQLPSASLSSEIDYIDPLSYNRAMDPAQNNGSVGTFFPDRDGDNCSVGTQCINSTCNGR